MVSGLSLYIPFHTGPVWDMHTHSSQAQKKSRESCKSEEDAPLSDHTPNTNSQTARGAPNNHIGYEDTR